jgi:hypothetical protein
MDIFTKKTTTAEPGDEVHNKLMSLAQLGKPRLCQSDGGWHCSVEIDIKSAGARFELTSGFGHSSPVAALDECMERLHTVQQSLQFPA